jgi:hypothetical protein
MGFFDKLKKGLKVEKTWGKPTRPEPERAPIPRAQSRYGSLAAWIKTTYGNRFRDGATSTEVETQLQNLLKELETTRRISRNTPRLPTVFGHI